MSANTTPARRQMGVDGNVLSIMRPVIRLSGILLLLCGSTLRADLITCSCDPSKPDTLTARDCSLCREAEKQPADEAVFFLKDVNPLKPNRWLALPRRHTHSLEQMTAEERTAIWTAAIAKGKELFGDAWGLAINGPNVVTQCHMHIHIGRLLQGIETDNYVVASQPEDIPVPANEGLWVHPVASQLHVHKGEQVTETVLLR